MTSLPYRRSKEATHVVPSIHGKLKNIDLIQAIMAGRCGDDDEGYISFARKVGCVGGEG